MKLFVYTLVLFLSLTLVVQAENGCSEEGKKTYNKVLLELKSRIPKIEKTLVENNLFIRELEKSRQRHKELLDIINSQDPDKVDKELGKEKVQSLIQQSKKVEKLYLKSIKQKSSLELELSNLDAKLSQYKDKCIVSEE